MSISTPELIAKKRDGKKLSTAEIQFLIYGYMRGHITDYQMSAWAMAVFFRGMTFEETAALTMAMRDSGRVVNFGNFRAPLVDKHSTGGACNRESAVDPREMDAVTSLIAAHVQWVLVGAA